MTDIKIPCAGADFLRSLNPDLAEQYDINPRAIPCSECGVDGLRRVVASCPNEALVNRILRGKAEADTVGVLPESFAEDASEGHVRAAAEVDDYDLIGKIISFGREFKGIGLQGYDPAWARADLTMPEQGASLREFPGIWRSFSHEANRSVDNLEEALVEAVVFTPVRESRSVQTRPGVPGGFLRKGRPTEYRTEYSTKYVDGPSGREPLIQIAYRYFPAWQGARTDSLLEERGNAPYFAANRQRRGNLHSYAVLVPQSLAQKFQQALGAGPAAARQLGDAIVQEFAPDTYRDAWNTEKAREASGDSFDHHYYPTYNTLPPEVPFRVRTFEE